MNALTLPRTAAALEYKAIRLPLTLLEIQVVARLLDDDSRLRLGVERALGRVDLVAGRLFADDELTRRGQALHRRADVLEKAVILEEKAAQRRAEASAVLTEEKSRGQAQRADAQRRADAKVRAVGAQEQAAKAQVRTQARARAAAEAKAIDAGAAATVAAERERLRETQQRIAARSSARTAAPKAQLSQAVSEKKAADAKRRDAARLRQLAAQERAAR